MNEYYITGKPATEAEFIKQANTNAEIMKEKDLEKWLEKAQNIGFLTMIVDATNKN